MAKLRLRKDQAEIQKALDQWTQEDEHRAGLPDPLRSGMPGSIGPDEEAVKAWWSSYCKALIEDREYWQSRTPPDDRPIEDLLDPKDLDPNIYNQIMAELSRARAATKPMRPHRNWLRQLLKHCFNIG